MTVELDADASVPSSQQRLTVVLGCCCVERAVASRLSAGQFVPLNEAADWPVEVYADGRLIARGELLTLEGSFCVRVTEIVADQTLPLAA